MTETAFADRRVGVAIVGLAGAVGTTVCAGLELLNRGSATTGLPLADVPWLVPYGQLVVRGWDVAETELLSAARDHGVLTPSQLNQAAEHLRGIKPWSGISGRPGIETLREQVERIAADISTFRLEEDLDSVVVVHLGPAEPLVEDADRRWPTAEALSVAIDRDDPNLPPSALYAAAAITARAGYVNFSTGLGADVSALRDLARRSGVPIAGRDGKTGQTLLKTALAPAFRARALRVRGWYSLNLLGNSDGATLRDPAAREGKIATKSIVLDEMLGYDVPDHIVHIDYYRPRGDAKEAWDAIDLVGFLDQDLQVRINFLCRDSILAAPLVIELARCIDLSLRHHDAGVIEELGFFFKSPMRQSDTTAAVHNVVEQERRLFGWLNERRNKEAEA